MSQCDWTCLNCAFRYRLKMYGVICNYIGVTGHMRGCPAGKGCDRKIRGDKLDGLDALLYHMIPAVRKKKEKPQKPPPPPPTPEEIAEKRRKNTERHRRWVERNREHVRDYQRERRKKKLENEALTPSGASRQQTARPPLRGGSPRAEMLPQGGSQDGGAA